MNAPQLDPEEQRVVDDVRRYGCHIVNVVSDDGDEPEFSYTVGLPASTDQPEVIVFSLKRGLRQSVLNGVLRQCLEGLRLSDGLRIAGLIEGLDCVTRRIVSPAAIQDHFGWAIWFHRYLRGEAVAEAYQLVWPGAEQGLFPWEAGCDAEIVALQPALYDGGSAA